MENVVKCHVNDLTNRHERLHSNVSIDCLPLRKGVCKEFRYHNVNSVSRHSKRRRLLDAYDNAKLMSSMASRRRKRCVNQKRQVRYEIVSNDGKVLYTLKASEVVNKFTQLLRKGVEFHVNMV